LKEEFSPAYSSLDDETFLKKIDALEQVIKDCVLCPRSCHVDRTAGETGFCKTGDMPFVSSWGPHFGEERPLVGRYGSGTIFMGNCNLGCLFCQNYSISHLGEGTEVSHEKLADVMIALQKTGCHNINFVTPTHQMAAILRAVKIASDRGLRVPLVYNCGGYEALETVKMLDGVIDIYMPDFKYAAREYAARYSDADDYPEVAKEALREMHRQVGDLELDERDIARRGLLVRHLVLPDNIAGTREVVTFISEEISKETYINIMDQYHPCFKAYDHPPLNRRISGREFAEAVQHAINAGLKRIDGVTA
jgi:putative pyruvate formate lyase activating enzyme